MKFLKKIAVSVALSAAMFAVAPATFAAEAHKDLNVVVLEAAKTTEANLLEAKKLLEQGGDITEATQNALNAARQSIKEFRYEGTERLRQKMNDKIKTAREAFMKNDNAKSLEDVNAALEIYKEMRKIYDAAH
jgi:predicted nucleic acid-binding protein